MSHMMVTYPTNVSVAKSGGFSGGTVSKIEIRMDSQGKESKDKWNAFTNGAEFYNIKKGQTLVIGDSNIRDGYSYSITADSRTISVDDYHENTTIKDRAYYAITFAKWALREE